MSAADQHPRRVVVIGAARSGTKILRDSLATATGAGVVPYDIGYVWRSGSPDHHDDVLDPDLLTPRTREFIADFIDKYAGGSGTVIEKTVGNTLRVPYVTAVLPDATYIHLIRNGVDVAESTCRQWQEPTDFRYLADKVRHFPLRLIPSYGRRYVGSLLRRRVARDGRVASWGPRYPGIDADLRECDLLTVCARQWRESVGRARRDLERLGVPVIEVRYESLVADPWGQVARISQFCRLPTSEEFHSLASSAIRPSRTGHGSRALGTAELVRLDAEIGPLLTELGYQRPEIGKETHE